MQDLIKMADKAQAMNAAADDAGPPESKAYDEHYYGEISSIKEFKSSHRLLTETVLKKAGGKFSSMRADHNSFWTPKSKIFTKDFVKRFPKFAGPS